MPLILELSTELERELTVAAQKAGLSLAEYSLQLLAMRALPDTTVTTGADLVAYWQRLGLIGSRTEILDSQTHARQIRNKAEHRHVGA
jgi:hypothetical protein